MPTLTVHLNIDEQAALRQLAHIERRNARAQAAMLIRRELERAGLLPADLSQPQSKRAEVLADDNAR